MSHGIKPVTIKGRHGYNITVPALSLGAFSVFQDDAGWNLTHTASGWRCLHCCCPLRAAAIIEAIESLIDWGHPPEVLRALGTAAGIPQIMSETPCPDPFHAIKELQ